MISKGYVAIFAAPLDKATISEFVASWLERFQKVEQTTPDSGTTASTLEVTKIEEIIWTNELQFRVSNGEEFTWIYLTLNQRAVETTGFPSEAISLCLDVLLELDGVVEIVEDKNHKRLDQLEAEGLL